MKTLVLLVLLTGLALGAPRTGDEAPAFSLPRLGGDGDVQLSSLLGSGPVLVWFPNLVADTAHELTSLHQVVHDCGAKLVVIPLVGPDPQGALGLVSLFPEVQVLHDADGSVTLQYLGEFIVGVDPRQNLFLLDNQGRIRQARFYPGIPPRVLTGLLTDLR